MGPLTAQEHASLSHFGLRARDHWRVKTAVRVCENCPVSAFTSCLRTNRDTPGVRAGQYLGEREAEQGRRRVS